MAAKRVIFDCDGGSDDAWALLLLLKAEEEKLVVILGITICGSGNTTAHNAARNMWRILKASNRLDIPIFLGAAESILATRSIFSSPIFHGKDGFGDILPVEDVSISEIVDSKHAVFAIKDFCVKHPKMVTIISVGPLTNIALCYTMFPEEFGLNVKDFYIMGGNYQGVGNYARAAEFNFFADTEAAHAVLKKAKCPITILPWEACLEDRFFISIKWRLMQFAELTTSNPIIKLLTKVESAQFSGSGYESWNPCDAMLVAVFLFDKVFINKESSYHCLVELTGHARGQMILDHLQDVKNYPPNVRLIELVKAEFFTSAIQWVAGLKTLQTLMES